MFKKISKFAVLASLPILLIACGGGDGGGSTNSSYSATITKNGITYTCKSETAFNDCSNNSNCSSCTAPASPTATKITTQCSDVNNTISVTTDGCVFNAGGTQTGVCVSSSSLRMLSGTDKTKQEVIASGSLFSGSSLTLGGKKITCT
ncbi:hypothetical protein [Acinetobacter populi]|uniref:Lipoprotein n=1 Tax=Acinetobacter populi TaxID=1582270 RepID=A0A1Z9Z3P9_9GAMM|nr:hypothetical protein [Acinetobacter populi]OUY09070.1 hypothetical protein CAP51_05575 [Acinetobacter populi]